ncbi:MAG: GNAT family N-acetyltransferase [Bacteroidales bacterium]|nr:GNAT family N-acetyltransferase [Bacteroidales bacterium]
MEIRLIKYRSEDYFKSVELRDKILRKPLGMVFTDEFLKQDEKEFMIGLFEQNQIKAVLHLKPLSDTVLKMRQVAVDENMQGKGYGSKLVLFSEEFARKKHYKKIVMHARETAVSFYKKLDYSMIGEPFFEIGISHFKMEKKL